MASNIEFISTTGYKITVDPQNPRSVTIWKKGENSRTLPISDVFKSSGYVSDADKQKLAGLTKDFLKKQVDAGLSSYQQYLDYASNTPTSSTSNTPTSSANMTNKGTEKSQRYTWTTSDGRTTYLYDPANEETPYLKAEARNPKGFRPVRFKPAPAGYIPLSDGSFYDMVNKKRMYKGADTFYDSKDKANASWSQQARDKYARNANAASADDGVTDSNRWAVDWAAGEAGSGSSETTQMNGRQVNKPSYTYTWQGNRQGADAEKQQQAMVDWYNAREGYNLNADFTRYGNNGVDRKWGRASDAQYKQWLDDQVKWEGEQNKLTNEQLLTWEDGPLTEANKARLDALNNYNKRRTTALNFQGTQYADEASYNAAVEAENKHNAGLNAYSKQIWDDKMKKYAGYLDQDRNIPKNRLNAVANINKIYATNSNFNFNRRANPTSKVIKDFNLTGSEYRQARRQYNRGARRGAYDKGASAQAFYSNPVELQTDYGQYSGPAALTADQLGATTFEPQSQKQGGKLSYIDYIYK